MTARAFRLLAGLAGVAMLGGPASAAAGAAGGGTGAPATDPQASATRNIAYRQWTSAADFGTGTADGTTVTGNALTLASVAGTRSYTDPFGSGGPRSYDYATWTSASVSPGFGLTELVASWNASTPGGTWIQVDARGVTGGGSTTKWYVMGRWAADDNELHRTSVPSQGDANGSVAIDTFVAASGVTLVSWQVRVTLYRPAGGTDTPTVRSIGAMASALPPPGTVPASPPGGANGVTIDVPRYSQEIHAGEYPQWDGGGEAWCSPTSTSMVLAYWGSGPTPADYDWVDPSYADPWVDYAARNTYDYNYDGAGNWPYNTAYAGRFGLDGFVTRLRSLTEAEQFISAGIPLVLSLSFKKNEIPGLDYGTNGHLLVLAGFSGTGDPVLNDPFASTDAGVRKVAGRAQFESAWLNSSRGIAYVIHPSSVPLPPAPPQANW